MWNIGRERSGVNDSGEWAPQPWGERAFSEAIARSPHRWADCVIAALAPHQEAFDGLDALDVTLLLDDLQDRLSRPAED